MTAQRGCDTLLELAKQRVSSEFTVVESRGVCLVSTPFLRHDNDPITLRIEPGDAGKFIITDGGETIDYLRLSGLTVRGTSSFRSLVRNLELSFGVTVQDEEILVKASEGEFAEGFEAVARAAQHLSYLIYRRRPHQPTRFDEKVEAELIRAGAKYETDVVLQGATKPAMFRFFVNSGRNMAIQPLSATTRGAADNKAERLMFHIIDIQRHSEQYKFYAIVDDASSAAGSIWSSETLNALEHYADGVVRWSLSRARIETIVR